MIILKSQGNRSTRPAREYRTRRTDEASMQAEPDSYQPQTPPSPLRRQKGMSFIQKYSLKSILFGVLGYPARSLSVVRAIILSNGPPSPGTFLHLAHFILLHPPPPPLSFPPSPLNCASGATSSLAQCLYHLVKGLSS